ncbi:MAG: sigma-70 family RNA polymerase sigma factor [Oscillospiraceae bacterium]|nr:sigma-70 family RNA polymerase sigma factor [Oscillospiraceae bacterium]
MTEAKALRLLQRGSTEALKWFINQYTPYVSTIIYNIIGSAMTAADVEEVASDVFFAFWTNADKVNLLSVRGYLGSIARNKAKNKFREAGYELTLEDDLYITEDLSLEERCLEEELHAIVKREVLSTKEPEREILLRYYYYCQSIGTISREMGLSQANVKVKLHRARNALKTTLAAYFSDQGGG